MYLSHFGLRELPFGLTPDPSFFLACSTYQEALNTLLVAARNGEGFIKIVGEVGAGKTLLCRKFRMALNGEQKEAAASAAIEAGWRAPDSGKFVTACIFNPYLEPRSLLLALANEFRVQVDDRADQHRLLKGLALALLGFARDGKRALVCLDEAQAMPLESLEVLRLLTNLETEKRKLLQVVLFGQPELDDKLRRDTVRQLRQRITFQYELQGLRKGELERYLRHRLGVAGYRGETLFRRDAVRVLQHASRGTPRLVNIIAHKSMLLAYGEGRQQVRARHVRAAVADTPEARHGWNVWSWSMAALALSVFALVWMALP